MHLSPRDLDKLVLHQAGFVAQKRLARGLRLNYPEAAALIATQLLELIRDGSTVFELMMIGRTILGTRQVLPGVESLLHEVQVEGTFVDGTKLVTVHDPISLVDGDLAIALYGTFLPLPHLDKFGDRPTPGFPVAPPPPTPGAIEPAGGEIELNAGLIAVELEVIHRGDRPIQVGSHYPFADTNRALEFDSTRAVDHRLDIPAGTATRFEPGDTRTVRLIPVSKGTI